MAYISCRDLCVGYDGKPVLNNLDFDVCAGDYLCIVGENGSGKSTLMKTILGLIAPVSGKVEFADGLKRTEIGYLPQQTVVQKDFPASVSEIVLSGCLSHLGKRLFYGKAEKNLAAENMKKMHIYPLKNACYRNLSGGQQQRVLLARALCATQKLLLLDEPVSGLDPTVTEEMYELIAKLHEEGIAIIMITHDLSAAAKYATKVLHIGHEIFFGSKQEYLSASARSEIAGQGGKENA